MKNKILIAGGGGMLAWDFGRIAVEHGYDVLSVTHGEMDIADPSSVWAAIKGFKPNYVVNASGIDVDACEINPSDGYRVHTWAATVLAQACERISATLVYMSSCGLFGDDLTFYSEYDPVVLKTKYARSKYLGELEAQQHCQRVFVVRCGWLFGGTPSHRRNFVFQRIKEAKQNTVINSAGDKYGSPTLTSDLSEKILALLSTDLYGTYHISNAEGCSRYEYTTYILHSVGLKTHVEKVDSSAFPRPASTPDSEMLTNLKLQFSNIGVLGSWQEAIERYVASLKKDVCV
ncbi:MAG: hypothetical protein CMH81_00725 [Nitrospiraceae bacterium]|nr:hypothetical protein [Nitrospiraceae bacterium]